MVYLSPKALASLKAWFGVRPHSSDQAVFLNRYGRRLTVAGIQYHLKTYCHRAGVRLTCHQLRHTFGRQLTEAQMPVTTIQRLLGHAQLRTTQLYTHLSNRQAQAEYEAAMAHISGWFGIGGQQ